MPAGLTVQPVLLLSLPRSGSTLVQRVLGAHPRVATVSEPWFLLPLAYSLREEGARAEYWHPLAAMATADLAEALPGGRDEYLAEIGRLAMRIYERLAGDADVFVDKTPRYHLIGEDLPQMLPEARFVFLWRNPLAVTASLLRTFRAGRFEPDLFSIDLDRGVENLTAMWERHRRSGTAIGVRFEDLLSGTDEWHRMFEHLGLEFEPSFLAEFDQVELRGRYGDPTGTRDYRTVSAEPRDKWLTEFESPVRRAWARRYLKRIGDERMRAMGYDTAEVLNELRTAAPKARSGPEDLYRLLSSRGAHKRHQRTVNADDSPRPVG